MGLADGFDHIKPKAFLYSLACIPTFVPGQGSQAPPAADLFM